ncbi:MAG: ABC transporter permease [Alicyclobacillus sp.]|nr:ABC transporter permease [Alicyclobacillus sp.]
MKLLRRVGLAIIMVIVVTTAIFFLVHLMPGNPYDVLVNQLIHQGVNRTQAENQVKALFGYEPNAPLVQQYFQYVRLLLHGSLGTSLMYPGQPVLQLIAKAVPWTVLVVAVSLLISFAIGTLFGALAAYLRGSWFDHLITIGSSLLNGIPQYLTGILLFYFFAVILRWFPMGGAFGGQVTPGWNFGYIGSVLHHAILPIAAFVISSFSGWALSMKSNTISVLGEDFITAAKAMAIRERYIILQYVSKNAILPLFTGLVLSIGFIFGGSLFVEQIFNYPGLGYLFTQATYGRDFPLLEGCFLLLTVAVIFSNLAADLLYSKLDPRIKS